MEWAKEIDQEDNLVNRANEEGYLEKLSSYDGRTLSWQQQNKTQPFYNHVKQEQKRFKAGNNGLQIKEN